MIEDYNGLDIVGIRLVKERRLYSDKAITSPTAAIELVANELQWMDREYFMILHLNSQNQVLSTNIVSVGGLDFALAEPREVFKSALLANARSIILLHNHPSGSVIPSREDILISRRIHDAGRLLGISCLDHVIIGRGNYLSMKEENIIFQDNNIMDEQLQNVSEKTQNYGEQKERVSIDLNYKYIQKRTGVNGDFYSVTMPAGIKIKGTDVSFWQFTTRYQSPNDEITSRMTFLKDQVITIKNMDSQKLRVTGEELAKALDNPQVFIQVPLDTVEKFKDGKKEAYRIVCPKGMNINGLDVAGGYIVQEQVKRNVRNPMYATVCLPLNQAAKFYKDLDGNDTEYQLNPANLQKAYQEYNKTRDLSMTQKIQQKLL